MRAVKIILGCFHTTSHLKVCSQLTLPPLEVRRKISLLTYFYKIINGYAPSYLNESCPKILCHAHASSYSSKRPLNVKISFVRTCLLKNSFHHKSAKLWNLLPTDIQNSNSISSFVMRLKKYYNITSKPKFLHLKGENVQLVAMHCMLRMGHRQLMSTGVIENVGVEKQKF